MKTLKLMNLDTLDENGVYPAHIQIGEYRFDIDKPLSTSSRKHIQNAVIQFSHNQKDSIFFSEGLRIKRFSHRKRIKRKILEDILILGSILTATNWTLYSDRYNEPNGFSRNFLNCITYKKTELENLLNIAYRKIQEPEWQKQFDFGFHIRMLYFRSNIANLESRFLSSVVIWEWLYPHFQNPHGATEEDECWDLNHIINTILRRFWPQTMVKNNIFTHIRNQLAHSGKMRINRRKADSWMKDIPWESSEEFDIKDYLKFFNQLTQVIVLKTLDINADDICKHKIVTFTCTGKL